MTTKGRLSFVAAVLVLAGVVAISTAHGGAESRSAIAIGTVIMANPGIPWSDETLSLVTRNNRYVLVGSIESLDEHVGARVAVTGWAYSGPQGVPCFNVQQYRLLP